MSADNYFVIRQEGELWCGYHQFASNDEEQFTKASFKFKTLEEAIKQAQEEYTEYGYRVAFPAEAKERKGVVK